MTKPRPKQQGIELSPGMLEFYESFPDLSGRQAMTSILDTAMGLLPCNPMTDMFSSPIQAHEFMLMAWKPIWRHSIAGVKGLFTKNELLLIIDIHNGHMVTFQTYGSNSLAVCISDSIVLDGVDEKWKVDPGSILEKAKSLTPIQAFCLELWANGYWYGREQEKDYNKYVTQL